jgi:RHH-type proline utilization regulon transcriptional repressor/proline dehydrogenase/delta 1-pyrroline-5-carboxylate dehydrogenase
MGIHTRIESRADLFSQQCNIGNIYINRDMVGAVVGSQPFGGRGLSGSGYKAGGPNYLMQFLNEKVVSKNCLISKKSHDWIQKSTNKKCFTYIFVVYFSNNAFVR